MKTTQIPPWLGHQCGEKMILRWVRNIWRKRFSQLVSLDWGKLTKWLHSNKVYWIVVLIHKFLGTKVLSWLARIGMHMERIKVSWQQVQAVLGTFSAAVKRAFTTSSTDWISFPVMFDPFIFFRIFSRRYDACLSLETSAPMSLPE